MALSPPDIVGGLSPLSTSVRVRNQASNAEVFVFRNGSLIGRHKCLSPDEVIEFFPGTKLNEEDKITTAQTHNSETSVQTPFPTSVQKLAPPFGDHRFVSHVYRCSTSLFLAGVTPGADMELSASGGPIGTGRSVDGGVVVRLTSAVGPKAQVTSHQKVKGGLGTPITSSPADDPRPSGPGFLPQLFFDKAPRACQTAVDVSGLIDGAEALVRARADDPASESVLEAPIPVMRFRTPPLEVGKTVSVKARMERCRLESPELTAVVLPPDLKPVIKTDLCTGTKRVTVAGVQPGAWVAVRQGSKGVGGGEATDDVWSGWIEPLSASGGSVVATASMCGVSQDSPAKPVTATPTGLPAVSILEPLMACSMTLWVKDAHPGALLAAFSDKNGLISAWQDYSEQTTDKVARIDLTLPLKADHLIHVVQIACDSNPVKSANEPKVKATLGPLPVPTIVQPVFEDHYQVKVKGAHPGAIVELYGGSAGFLSSATADHNGVATLVPEGGPYGTVRPSMWLMKERIAARQILCDLESALGSYVPAEDRTPSAPKLISPAEGAGNVADDPTLVWLDQGAGTPRQATSFLVELTDDKHPLFDALFLNEVVASTSFPISGLPKRLLLGQNYIWRVQAAMKDTTVPGYAGDSNGLISKWSSAGHFTVKAAPPPPLPVLDSVKKLASGNFQVKGRNFLGNPSHRVHIRVVRTGYAGDTFNFTSDAAGNLDVEVPVPAQPPGTAQLFFSANDERPSSTDLTGVVWSNTITIPP